MASFDLAVHLPPASITFPLLLSAFIVYNLVAYVANYRKLRHFKGPPLASFSSLWLIWQTCRARLHDAQIEALRKYGSPARIGPQLLVTDDPDLLRHMSAPRSKWTRGSWYDGMKLDPRRNNVFSERNEKRHAEMRSKMIGAYSGKDVDNLESCIDEQVQKLIEYVDQRYLGRPMEFANATSYFTMDVLSKVAFGNPFGYLDADCDLYDYQRLSKSFILIQEFINNHPSFRAIIQSRPIQAVLAPKGTDKVGQGPILRAAHDSVAKGYDPSTKPTRDMIGHFRTKGMTRIEAEAESHLQILAGSESTSNAIRATFMCLVANPTAYQRLRNEIDEAHAAGNISSPIITYTEATTYLPYLQAVIWEGLRLHPPLFGLKSKLAPFPHGDTFKGLFYPPGTEVANSDAGMTRRTDIFGDDALLFRPERWTEADEETKEKYLRVTDLIFGNGRFSCMGRNIAMIELNKVFVELIRNFDWSIADPFKNIKSWDHGVFIREGMDLVARRRSR